MILPLQLRQVDGVLAAPDAWFLPGDSAARWLEELSRSGLAESGTRLFVVPRSLARREPAGLLVIPARTGAPARPPGGLACRLLAGRLFVPVDAIPHPPVTDIELRSLCALPVAFLHPALGLSGFEEEAASRVWDLLEGPAERSESWNFARPGPDPLPEFSGIQLADPPSPADLFGGAEQDIGAEPMVDLPPDADEPRDNALANSGRKLREFLARGVAGVAGRMPHGGSRHNWINKVEDWAWDQLQKVNDQLEHLRHKELRRLLKMLETDPEAGLRHAIPMNDFAHRGVAPPGGSLGPRPVDFDPGRLGGRAADFWHIPEDLTTTLRERYRELANRELQLGRHHRAAYVFAELLGDLVSAANALKQGGHYREAALLYDEHLKDPVAAARCLSEGGLLAEAIERWIKLGSWLEVSALYERMDRPEAAKEALRKVVAERVVQGDLLGAAQLLEERLLEVEEALAMLCGAWPGSRQAGGCMTAAFKLLGRLGRHKAALDLLARFDRDTSQPLVLPLLGALSGVARDYPHALARQRAADHSRVLISRQLGRNGLAAEEAARLLDFLVRLAPQDRLVARDVNRYVAGLRDTVTRARRVTPPPAVKSDKPEVVRWFALPSQIEWLALRSEWHWFYAAGVTERRLTLVRGGWEGVLQSCSWACPATIARNALVLEGTGERGSTVILATPGGPPLNEQRLPASDQFFGQTCLVGTPEWIKPQHWPISFGENCLWTTHLASGRGILSCHDKSGNLQRTIDVTAELLEGAVREPATRLSLACVNGGVAIALGNRLVVNLASGSRQIELPGQVTGLVATLPHTRAGLMILLEHGAVMYWLGETELVELVDLPAARAAFVPGGPLALLSGAQLALLDIDSRRVNRITRTELTGQKPVGICATASPGQFAILCANGRMTVYRKP